MKNNLLSKNFVPDISSIYNESFSNQLAETRGAIGSLKQIPRLLTNANLLMRPILGKEAESSSQLEGTQASIEDVFKMDVVDQTMEERHEAEEILNYERAMLVGIQHLKKYDLNLFVIRDLHKTLMCGVRGSKKSPGEFRKKEVWIGQSGTGKGSARYIPPEAIHVPVLMEKLEKFIANHGTMNPLIAAGIIHHRFEAIHPFEDGNGRVGRLLITLFLIKKGVLEMPILYPSGYFEQHKRLYMSALSKVDRKEDWTSWLSFFLKALEKQANVALSLSIEIDELFKKNRSEIDNESAGLKLIKVLETTFSQPFLTAPRLSRTTGISRISCIRYLDKLVEKKIIVDEGIQGGQRVYTNRKLLRILKSI